MTTAIVEVNGVQKLYNNGVRALKGVSFQVNPGDFVAIIGLSGSGKSTMLRCLNRLIDPSSGSIKFKGEEITGLSRTELRRVRRKIGMVFQHFNLVDRKSVLTNVLSGKLGSMGTLKSIGGFFSEADKKAALEKLEIVGLPDKPHVRADELSGGQKQRVAIARALMQDPDLILADEPVASLDPATSHSVMRYLQKVNKDMGKTVICNLHFLSLVRQYANRVIALKGGEVVFQGGGTDIDNKLFKEIYGEDAVETV